MGKLFGGVTFFLVAVIIAYFLNLSQVDTLAQLYYASDPLSQVPHVVATFELLHHPFVYFWVIPSWLIAGFLCGIVTRTWKGTIIVSLITAFILSLTWIFLMSKYTPNYWNAFLSARSTLDFLGQTMGIGLLLGLFAAAPALCGAYLISPPKKDKAEIPIKEIQTICPNCGATFQSKPKFCYKCNTLLSKEEN